MKHHLEQGLSLVELLMSVSMLGILGFATLNLYQFSQKESMVASENIQALISRFGASKVILNDISDAEASFNLINLKDDDNLPFFTLPTNELCTKNCTRKLTLRIPPGEKKSQSIYFILRRGQQNEMLKFTIDPRAAFSGSNYRGINRYPNSDSSIAKRRRAHSPWDKNRLILLTSELSFYDCKNTTRNSTNCNFTCRNNLDDSCSYIAKRPMRFIGTVTDDDKDLTDVSVPDGSFFDKSFHLCVPNKDSVCEPLTKDPVEIKSPQDLFENLPIIPGMDNRTHISPIQIIAYSIRRDNINSPEHTQQLIRTRVIHSEGKLVLGQPRVLMTGISEAEFRRENISIPIIEYRLKKVRMRKSIK